MDKWIDKYIFLILDRLVQRDNEIEADRQRERERERERDEHEVAVCNPSCSPFVM